MRPALAVLVAALAASSCLLAPGADAASKARVSDQKTGEVTLTVSEDDTRDATTVTLMCSPTEGQYAVILVIGSGPASQTDTEIAITADGSALGTKRFEGVEESLMLLPVGDEGRTLVGRLTKAKAFTLGLGPRSIRFVPGDHPAEIARYIASCRF